MTSNEKLAYTHFFYYNNNIRKNVQFHKNPLPNYKHTLSENGIQGS